MVDSTRYIIAFGLTGAGKSYTLNLLAGVDDTDDLETHVFKCEAKAKSVTSDI